jgi:hypothetical protein
MTRSQGICCRHWPGFGRRRLRFFGSLGGLFRYGLCARERTWKVKRPAQIGRWLGYRWWLCSGQVLEARAQRRHRLDGRFVRGLAVDGHGGRLGYESILSRAVPLPGGSSVGGVEDARCRLVVGGSRVRAERSRW